MHNIIICLIILVSCQGEPVVVNSESNQPIIDLSGKDVIVESNNLLIKSSREFVTGDGPHIDEDYGSIQELGKQYLKIDYLNDTIHAQAIQYVNACGDAIAWIELKADTLILTTKEQSEMLCLSSDWYMYEYWIKNSDYRKYVIMQK